MGVVWCKKHGEQYIDITSPLLIDSFFNKKTINVKKIVIIIGDYIGGRRQIVVDEDFLEKHNLTKNDEPSVLEEKYFDFFDELRPTCPICFREYLNEIGFDGDYDNDYID